MSESFGFELHGQDVQSVSPSRFYKKLGERGRGQLTCDPPFDHQFGKVSVADWLQASLRDGYLNHFGRRPSVQARGFIRGVKCSKHCTMLSGKYQAANYLVALGAEPCSFDTGFAISDDAAGEDESNILQEDT